jgi:hypothetical protein
MRKTTILFQILILGYTSFKLVYFTHTTGCLKKNAMEIQQAVVHHKLN